VLIILGAVPALWAYYVFLGGNFHTVVAGGCYRSGQLSDTVLQQTLGNYRIRTVINLRGANLKADWYNREQRVIEQHGCGKVDVRIGSSFVPSEQAIRSLVVAIDKSEPPLLLHCVTGADRTGLASAFFKLLKTNADLDTASTEMSIRYGHNPLGSARCLDCVLDHYRCWLALRDERHTPEQLREWAERHYRRDEVVRRYELPREPREDDD